jgi:peptidoglycan/LPS O-acetylase OafA/YrhL
LQKIFKHGKIEFANTLRGLAALSVVIAHYLGFFWLARNYVSPLINAPVLPATHRIPTYVLLVNKFTLLNWGSYGVALFFIISGFVIPFSLQKKNSLEFIINRLFRIVPTYVIGFSVTLCALFLSTKYFSKEWPYTFREVWIHYLPGIRDVLWSRSIDGIIWTLEIEMKFYLVTAVAIVWFQRYSTKVFLIPIFCFLLTYYLNHLLPGFAKTNLSSWQLALTGITVFQYIIFMFIGVLFHYLYSEKITPDKAYLGVGGLFILFCLDWWLGPNSSSLGSAWSYAFALLTFMFAYSFPNFFKANPIFNFLANISYPLYVIHGIMGYVILRIMLEVGYKEWVSLLATFGMAMSISWLIHRLIERPSQRFGTQIGVSLNNQYLLLNKQIKQHIALIRS